MRCNRSVMSTRYITFSLWLCVSLLAPAIVAAQNDNANGNSALAFWNSLTSAERKLPRDILVTQRLAAGKTVPPGWERSAEASSKNRSSQVSERLYRLDGDSLAALESVLWEIGAEVISKSRSRAYLTTKLSDEQVVSVSTYPSVASIRYVKGPKAQGVTQAWQAHRIADMDGAGQPSNLSSKPALSGDGVVIGIISNTIKQADLDGLKGLKNIGDVTGTCAIPPVYGDSSPPSCSNGDAIVYKLTGVSDADGVLPSVISTGGAADGLNMLQVMYDIAPDAKFIIASPGDSDSGLAGDQSTPADMARVVAKLVAGNNTSNTSAADYLPPANIIVDDLDYLTQNPFEVGEVSEAIIAARAAGVLYITAAGDGGHFESSGSTSNVYMEAFNSQSTAGLTGNIYDGLSKIHAFPDTKSYLTLTEPLSDICVFWAADPTAPSGSATPAITLWIAEDLVEPDNDQISGDEPLPDFFPFQRPGGCASEIGFAGTTSSPLPVGTKIILEDASGNPVTSRFMIVGERPSTSTIVDSSGNDSIAGTFNLSTPGAIRGHAYHPSALTVGATPWVLSPSSEPYAFNDSGLTLEVSDYSSDGESSGQQRFYWQNTGTTSPNWQANSGGAASKPDLTATSKISVRKSAGGAEFYHGTSASAAAAAGIAALYWEFRQWQLSEVSSDQAVTDDEIFSVMQDATIDGGASGWDRQFGLGVLDGPKSLETPPLALASALSVTPDVGGVTVQWLMVSGISGSSSTSLTLNCSQGSTQLVTNQTPSASGTLFVEADSDAPVECSAVTSVTSGGQTETDSATPKTASATAEPLSSGLPVWLLYVASQPQTVTATDQSVGTSAAQDTPVRIDGTSSAGQTFTAGVSGELNSVTLYLREGGAATDGMTLEIKSVENDLPSGTALATVTIPDSDIPTVSETVAAVTVAFETSVTLVAGEVYSILLQTNDTAGYDLWYNSDDYAQGSALQGDGGGTNWSAATHDFSFQTVVTSTQ